jgi:hypothetical protein
MSSAMSVFVFFLLLMTSLSSAQLFSKSFNDSLSLSPCCSECLFLPDLQPCASFGVGLHGLQFNLSSNLMTSFFGFDQLSLCIQRGLSDDPRVLTTQIIQTIDQLNARPALGGLALASAPLGYALCGGNDPSVPANTVFFCGTTDSDYDVTLSPCAPKGFISQNYQGFVPGVPMNSLIFPHTDFFQWGLASPPPFDQETWVSLWRNPGRGTQDVTHYQADNITGAPGAALFPFDPPFYRCTTGPLCMDDLSAAPITSQRSQGPSTWAASSPLFENQPIYAFSLSRSYYLGPSSLKTPAPLLPQYNATNIGVWCDAPSTYGSVCYDSSPELDAWLSGTAISGLNSPMYRVNRGCVGWGLCPVGLNGFVCGGQGQCLPNSKCFCKSGWGGLACDQPVPGSAIYLCSNFDPCSGNGLCQDTAQGAQCLCYDGWHGSPANGVTLQTNGEINMYLNAFYSGNTSACNAYSVSNATAYMQDHQCLFFVDEPDYSLVRRYLRTSSSVLDSVSADNRNSSAPRVPYTWTPLWYSGPGDIQLSAMPNAVELDQVYSQPVSVQQVVQRGYNCIDGRVVQDKSTLPLEDQPLGGVLRGGPSCEVCPSCWTNQSVCTIDNVTCLVPANSTAFEFCVLQTALNVPSVPLDLLSIVLPAITTLSSATCNSTNLLSFSDYDQYAACVFPFMLQVLLTLSLVDQADLSDDMLKNPLPCSGGEPQSAGCGTAYLATQTQCGLAATPFLLSGKYPNIVQDVNNALELTHIDCSRLSFASDRITQIDNFTKRRKCQCFPNYGHSNWSNPVCDAPICPQVGTHQPCGAPVQGQCIPNGGTAPHLGYCQCYKGFTGAGCEIATCPSVPSPVLWGQNMTCGGLSPSTPFASPTMVSSFDLPPALDCLNNSICLCNEPYWRLNPATGACDLVGCPVSLVNGKECNGLVNPSTNQSICIRVRDPVSRLGTCDCAQQTEFYGAPACEIPYSLGTACVNPVSGLYCGGFGQSACYAENGTQTPSCHCPSDYYLDAYCEVTVDPTNAPCPPYFSRRDPVTGLFSSLCVFNLTNCTSPSSSSSLVCGRAGETACMWNGTVNQLSCNCPATYNGSFCETLVGCGGACVFGRCLSFNGTDTCVCDEFHNGSSCNASICENTGGTMVNGSCQCPLNRSFFPSSSFSSSLSLLACPSLSLHLSPSPGCSIGCPLSSQGMMCGACASNTSYSLCNASTSTCDCSLLAYNPLASDTSVGPYTQALDGTCEPFCVKGVFLNNSINLSLPHWNESSNASICQCEAGFYGPRCNVSGVPCPPNATNCQWAFNPCANGGAWIPNKGCLCPPQYTSISNCSIPMCDPAISVYYDADQCQCLPPYGLLDSMSVTCSSLCQNGGTPNTTSGTCQCSRFYYGDYCEFSDGFGACPLSIQTYNFSLHRCVNQSCVYGTLNSQAGSCQCYNTYSGPLCSQDLCATQPSHGISVYSSTLINQNHYICVCDSGYLLDANGLCTVSVCGNTGVLQSCSSDVNQTQCIFPGADYNCLCGDGTFVQPTSGIPTCLPPNCGPHGHAFYSQGQLFCQCDPGWTSPSCSTPLCTSPNTYFDFASSSCECLPPFSEPPECMNYSAVCGSASVYPNNSMECQCPPGYVPSTDPSQLINGFAPCVVACNQVGTKSSTATECLCQSYWQGYLCDVSPFSAFALPPPPPPSSSSSSSQMSLASLPLWAWVLVSLGIALLIIGLFSVLMSISSLR